jgi:putative membrane-bound dehydrogenase-like protein
MKNLATLRILLGGLLLLSTTALKALDEQEGFKPLFNGKDLSGWDGNPKFWSVKDGAVTGQTTKENPTPHNTFLIWRDGTVDDFELRLSFKMIGGNSGIQYRSKEFPDWVIGGYQADFEAGKTYSGILYEERMRGILALRGQKVVLEEGKKPEVTGSVGISDEIQASIKQEDWNDYVVIAKGNHLIHKINGKTTVDVTDNDAKARAFSGLLAFQVHAGPPMQVQFKDVRIKRLKLEDKKKLVLVAGRPSHGPGDHEFNAGVQLLNKCLQGYPGLISTYTLNGWPRDPSAFDNADAILFFMDGGGGHPVIQGDHLEQLDALAKQGVGIGCAHYAVEVPKDKGGNEFLRWMGGYYEDRVSTNPHWDAEIKGFPNHPTTRGVKPFKINDEWYYNIHFRPNMEGVTPLLVAKPTDETRQGKSASPRGPYPHIVAASGRDEVLSWAVERADGGRGFGFTGGHKHKNWGDPNFRKFFLNAMVWLAKLEVPQNGVESTVTEEDLSKNLDPKGGNKPAAAAPSRNGAAAAKEQMKALKVADGLEASLFALEPMVRNPANMDIDARGRVWVTEGANYRVWQKWGKLRPDGDRVAILEDTDGDGVADKDTTFYQGNDVNTALGICVLGNKVIVSCSPNVLVFTDENGDGKADKKEVLFTGMSGVDHDHGVHAVTFGADGKLYFNMGNDGKQIMRADGTPVRDREGNEVNTKGKPFRQGLVFRCNMDGSDFEVLGHNFRNNFEVCVDSYGRLWQSDNDDDGNRAVRINYVMDYGNFGYTDEMTGAGWPAKRSNMEQEVPLRHWHQNDPGVVPNILITGAGSPTGICFYEGKLLPAPFQNQIIHCDAGPRVVRAYVTKPDGAGFKAEMVDILTSSDTWFRPSDVCVAPDGSIYVADWNDAGVGGHNMADQKLETMTGRVYRVAPKGHKPAAPQLKFETAADCVAALQSPNHEARYLAWTKLHEMQGKAEKDLAKLAKAPEANMRARALQLLTRIKGKEKKYLETALKDTDADVRALPLRYARVEKADAISFVKKLAKDPSAAVRRECALSLRHSGSPEAPALWASLAQQYDGHDRWYLEALGIGADKNEDAFFDAWLAQTGDQWNTPQGRDIVWRSRSKKAPALLAKIISSNSTPEAERAKYFRALDFISGPEKDAAVLELLSASTGNK